MQSTLETSWNADSCWFYYYPALKTSASSVWSHPNVGPACQTAAAWWSPSSFPKVDRTSASSVWRITMSFLRSKRRKEMSSFKTWLALMVSPSLKSPRNRSRHLSTLEHLSVYMMAVSMLFLLDQVAQLVFTQSCNFRHEFDKKNCCSSAARGQVFCFCRFGVGTATRKMMMEFQAWNFPTYLNLFGVEKQDSWILPSRALTHIPPGGKRKIIHSKVPWYSRRDMLVSKRVIFILAPFSGRATASGTHGVHAERGRVTLYQGVDITVWSSTKTIETKTSNHKMNSQINPRIQGVLKMFLKTSKN